MEATQLFKCLADETRLNSTLLIFREGEACVCELMEALDESQPKISRHLAQLRNCGLLADRRKDQWVFYSLHPGLPEWVHSILQQACNSRQTELQVLQDTLRAMKCRPNRC